MSKLAADPFDLKTLIVDPADGELLRRAKIPAKIQKRREQFIKVPWTWFERLAGTTNQTHRVAIYLLHLHWLNRGKPFMLANGMLRLDGISRQSKWRALADLEQRGLIAVQRRSGKSPRVQVLLTPVRL